jgi:hypothetical protein
MDRIGRRGGWWITFAACAAYVACSGTATIVSPYASVTCGAPPPRLAGTWTSQLRGQNLELRIQEKCFKIFDAAFWTVSGYWAWAGARDSLSVIAQLSDSAITTFSLAGSPSTERFRGLIITISEQQPFGSELRGTASGELPDPRAPDAPWTVYDRVAVVLRR